jgi:hypothetical protein
LPLKRIPIDVPAMQVWDSRTCPLPYHGDIVRPGGNIASLARRGGNIAGQRDAQEDHHTAADALGAPLTRAYFATTEEVVYFLLAEGT